MCLVSQAACCSHHHLSTSRSTYSLLHLCPHIISSNLPSPLRCLPPLVRDPSTNNGRTEQRSPKEWLEFAPYRGNQAHCFACGQSQYHAARRVLVGAVPFTQSPQAGAF